MLAHPGPERTIHGPTLTHHRTQVVHAGWPTLIDLKRRWQVSLAALAPFGGPRGQHGSSTTSGNYGNQPGTTGIAPSR
jgi:hypothetical protein